MKFIQKSSLYPRANNPYSLLVVVLVGILAFAGCEGKKKETPIWLLGLLGSSSATGGGGTSSPTIASFTPTTAAVGDTVTITGTNFSTTPSSNTVQFNGTAATVSAATTTSLTVTVPTGATTGTISVTVGGNTATSVGSFTVNVCSTSSSVTYSWGTFTEMCDGTVKLVVTAGTFGGQTYTAQTLYFAKCSHGQTYNSTTNDCTGTGSSSDYGATTAQYCNANDSTCDDGTILNGTGTSGAYTACNGMNSGAGTYGKTNWRVPTKNELKTLIQCTNNTMPTDGTGCGASNYTSPSINNLFPNTQSPNYWSSSANASSNAWFVGVNNGGVYYNVKADTGYVRCISGP